MNDTITVRGFVATDVRLFTTATGLPIANFRLASTDRRLDRETQKWVDAETNWYNVKAYRHLAQNAAASIHKGDPVLVTGRLRLRQWTNEEGRSGTAPDIEADVIGHNLGWGTAYFQRPASQRRSAAAEAADGTAGGPLTGVRLAAQELADMADSSEEVPDPDGQSGVTDSDDAPEAARPDADLQLVNTATGEVLDGQPF